MRRLLGPLLAGLGAFLLGLAVLLPTVVVPRYEKAPLDQYTVSRASGTGSYLNTQTFRPVAEDEITITRVTKGLVEESGDEVAVYEQSQTLQPEQMTEPFNVTTERIRFDRESGIGVGGRGDRPDHEGAYTVKLPFNTQKREYPVFESAVGEAFPVRYVRETSVDGLEVYEFRGSVPETKIRDANIPGSLVGSPLGSVLVEEVFVNPERVLYVEPRTGSIVATESSPRRFYRPADFGSQGGQAQETTIFDGQFSATEETRAELVADARDARDTLTLYGRTLPLVLGLLGALLVLGGVAFAVAERRRPRHSNEYATTAY